MKILNYILKYNIVRIFILSGFLFFSLDLFSQNNWIENRFYQSRGASDIICGSAYNVNKTDGRIWWTERWKNCRKRVWHQEFYSGFVYYWGQNGWSKKWNKGSYWYFTWYDFPVRIL